MFKSIKLLVLCSLLLLGGCATPPSIEQIRQDVVDYKLPKTPEEGKAIVYVVRPSIMGALISFNVFLDDKKPESEMGFTRANQYIYFNVSPGEHQILSASENWSIVNINAKPNDVIFLRQDVHIGFLVARNHMYRIDESEGKYHVKRLALGTVIKVDK
ncbi:DUF2846 domain-containing protein [Rickettsiales endosymbiont of Peranema trichophorum]|uniref:DUF2846 domain-containing protein n=1 Tax=Rickettsiales endosymbiont of Peranema trichophorum TaxID=2486577 RepID=UPI00102382C0|nr:DUF2846 domain-containing protein [Rickettsiales endosymbiont of Peranema trichophorum]RZI47559.1 DUF2846 domain-containing protein [Rickettsiales endosymbiont of Peranema trichophorum]